MQGLQSSEPSSKIAATEYRLKVFGGRGWLIVRCAEELIESEVHVVECHVVDIYTHFEGTSCYPFRRQKRMMTAEFQD